MERTIEQVNVEYTQTLAQAGEKTYLIHIKSEEIESLTTEREKLLNKARGLSREAFAKMQEAKATLQATSGEEIQAAPDQTTQAQDAVAEVQ